MKNYYRILFLTVAVAFLAVVPSSADSIPDNSVHAIRDHVLSYFKPVKGAVVSVADGDVNITQETGERIRNGARLLVFRKGLPFYHPTTKELLGYTDDFIGTIEVKEKTEIQGRYLCTVIKGDVKTGDVVRVTSSRIKLAFFRTGRLYVLFQSCFTVL